MSKYTQEQIADYLKRGGVVCITCHSTNVEGMDLEMEGRHIYQNVMCHDCNAEWTDEYTLTGVTEKVQQ